MIIVTGSVVAEQECIDELLASNLDHVRRSRTEPDCGSHVDAAAAGGGAKAWCAALLLALMGAAPPSVLAHGDTAHASARPAQQQPWGIAGDAAAARRTLAIVMNDTMRFIPDRIQVREGETVRLAFRNRGKVLHEFVLGTKETLDAHAAAMLRMPDMAHDEPWMVHVPPGRSGQIVWTFNRAGEFDFACLIPGHYLAGMVGRIEVLPAAPGGSKP